MSGSVAVRVAIPDDLPALGRLGALLVHTHYAFDAQRFMKPGPDLEHGYARFLGSLLGQPDVLVLAAEVDGRVVGYLYGAVEPQSWEALRDTCGYVHDVAVADEYRRLGVGRALVEAAAGWFTARGLPRVVLQTAAQNSAALAMFDAVGFRRTMIELTRELT